jgi:DNA polymerase elongation subunit (family B)
MIDLLKAEGARPVEIDTDGIYFQPPDSSVSEEDELAMVQRVSQGLPEGIEVELDGRYRSMFAYKTKNYALQNYDGRILIKGSGLRSRGMEQYLREFMRELIESLLNDKSETVETLYEEYIVKLRSRGMNVNWVSRTETLNESPESYREKIRMGKRNHSAAFEIALATDKIYRAGDQVSYYVSGSGKGAVAYENCRPVSAFDPAHPDINTHYYIEKLRHLKKKFEPFLPKEATLFDF